MPRPKEENDTDEAKTLAVLKRTLDQARGRSRRQFRRYKSIDEGAQAATAREAHKAWSDSIGEALSLADAISRKRAHDLADLATKFEALWWWIVEDDSVLDVTTRLWLARFRRSLIRLAGKV